MEIRETVMIKIKKEFAHWHLGTSGLFHTQMFFRQVELLHTYVMNRL